MPEESPSVQVEATKSSPQRQRRLLIGSLVVAILLTLFFGVRAVRRFIDRPTNEPIREWMSVPYIAHSYHVRPDVLFRALGLPDKPPPDKRPISVIAKELNLSTEAVIELLQTAIEQARPPKPPPPGEAPTDIPPPTDEASAVFWIG